MNTDVMIWQLTFSFILLCVSPWAALGEEPAAPPSYAECFKLLQEQVKNDALAQQALAKNPLAIPADLGADATQARLKKQNQNQSFAVEINTQSGAVSVTYPAEEPQTETPPAISRQAQCQAMYFLTY